MTAPSRTAHSHTARGPLAALTVALLLLGVALSSRPTLAADNGTRREPMVFISGLQGPGAVEVIKAINEGGACLNTVYYELPQDAPDDIDAVRAAIDEAAAAGLHVIVGLPTRLGAAYPISARNRLYVTAVTNWLEDVVGGLAGTDGISAWATDHFLERDISYTDEDLRQFLLERHGSLAALNESWGSDYRTLQGITREDARSRDQKQTHGVGRASVDVAEYERSAFHDVMALWAREIRRLDPDTPLMTGRISLYRSLTAIPDEYDIVQPHLPPDVLEPDLVTHNVQGVEMAQMGGRFDVIPWLRIPLPPSEAYRDNALYDWVLEAGLRGATGVGLEDWSRIANVTAWRNNTLTNLRGALGQAPFVGEQPRPTAAVICEPYAGGHEFFGTPAWGFIRDFPVRDLAELSCNYSLGSIFGGMDYLTMEQAAVADLSDYGVIFLPTCLSVPPDAAEALRTYVERGGALFGDLGLGMYQSQSWSPTYSPLAVLFGIAGAMEPADRFGTFRVGETHPAFPSVVRGTEALGTFVPGAGISRSTGHMTQYRFEGAASERRGYAFQGPSWFVCLSSGALPLATQSVRYDDERRPYFLGLTVSTIGAGLGVYAPFAAWSWWPPQDPLHAAVHCDLLSRRARYRLLSNTLVEPAVGISGSNDWLHLFRRSGDGPVEVLAGVADHRAYLGATATFSAYDRAPDGTRSGHARLRVDLPGGSLRHCQAIPVRLRPATGECQARVAFYSAGLVMLEVGGNGSVWGRERRGAREQFYGGTPTAIRVTVDAGLYPIEPDSSHQVTLIEGPSRSNAMTVTADHRGRLDFWLTTAGGRVEIAPAEQ